MRINEEYRVRKVAGENLVVKQGAFNADMTKVISLNESALFLWNELEGRDFLLEDVTNILISNYEVSPDQAAHDAQKWVDSLIRCSVIDA